MQDIKKFMLEKFQIKKCNVRKWVIHIEDGVQELIDSTDNLAKSLFENQKKMRDFLLTMSKMYNTSYNNILLLKNQREDISFVADKATMEKCKFHVKDEEEPLEIIKRIKVENEVKFKIDKVYDISQTDAVKREQKSYSKEYIETILKGMCSRRGLGFESNNPMADLENIIIDICNNSRPSNVSKYNVDQHACQIQVEVSATIFSVAKKININVRNYNLKDICKWGIDKDTRTLKESLKYIQKFTNYFIKDFQTQEKLNHIENEKQEDEEME